MIHLKPISTQKEDQNENQKNFFQPHCLIAGKKYYFGTGGGTDEFIRYCQTIQTKSDFNSNFSSGFNLVCEKVWMEEDGKSNMREIIKITKQQTI